MMDQGLLTPPRNKREARAWVRLHWQTFMRQADCPNLGTNRWSDEAEKLVADVFCVEGAKLAERLHPKRKR